MLDNRSSFQAKTPSGAIWFSLTAFGCLQAMNLTPMKLRPNDVPQAHAGWFFRPMNGSSHHPSIYGMRVEGLLGLAFCFLESILFSQLFGLITTAKMHF